MKSVLPILLFCQTTTCPLSQRSIIKNPILHRSGDANY